MLLKLQIENRVPYYFKDALSFNFVLTFNENALNVIVKWLKPFSLNFKENLDRT